MHAAGIISDHSPERTPAMRGGVATEGQTVLARLVTERVEDDAWLNAREFLLWMNFQNAIHVFGKIEDDGNVAALPGETRAAAARSNRRAEFAAERERFLDI